MKVRINITVQDYFQYIGTSPNYPLKRRVRSSIPYELQNGYNLKFKVLRNEYPLLYRVHISVDVKDISIITEMEKRSRDCFNKPTNISYRLINNPYTNNTASRSTEGL